MIIQFILFKRVHHIGTRIYTRREAITISKSRSVNNAIYLPMELSVLLTGDYNIIWPEARDDVG